MKNFTVFLMLSLVCLPLKAQVSGYKGKKNALTISSQPLFWYSEPVGAYATADYTRVITRNNTIVLQARMTGTKQQYVSDSEGKNTQEKISILQFGVFYEIYNKKDWSLAPVGFKHRFGITHTEAKYNVITTTKASYPSNPSLSVLSKKGSTDKFAWQSLVYEIAYREPITGNLCTILGTGIEIPIAPFDSEIGIITQLVRKSIASRVLSLGLSYVF